MTTVLQSCVTWLLSFPAVPAPQSKQTEPSLILAAGEAQAPRRTLTTWVISATSWPGSNVHDSCNSKAAFHNAYESALLCGDSRAGLFHLQQQRTGRAGAALRCREGLGQISARMGWEHHTDWCYSMLLFGQPDIFRTSFYSFLWHCFSKWFKKCSTGLDYTRVLSVATEQLIPMAIAVFPPAGPLWNGIIVISCS